MADVTETARARVQKLGMDWDWPDPAVLEDILALGEEAVPALAELLTPELLALARTEQREDSVVYYAVQLLGASGSAQALPILIGLLSRADDDLIETMGDAFLRLGPICLDPLLGVVGEEALGWLARVTASAAAMNLAADNPVYRARVADGLRPLLAASLERGGPQTEDELLVVSSLVADLADLADPAARPLIDAAFDADCVDPTFIERADVERLYNASGPPLYREVEPYLEEYRDQYRRHQEEEKTRAGLSLFDQRPAQQPVVLGPKLGRNDPCWCGSGKKYKKCHLAQDEKDKVRL